MNVDFYTEIRELENVELPENDEFEVDDDGRYVGDTGSVESFQTIGICEHINTVCDRTLREGTRVSAIMYREDGEWNTYMIRPIQVGCPDVIGPLNDHDEDQIGGDNVAVTLELQATLVPKTDDPHDTDLTFGEIKIRAGSGSLALM